MTREEATNRLRNMIIEMRTYCDESKRMSETDRQDMETFDMAIKALENQTSVIAEIEKIKAEMDNKGWYNRHDKEQFAEIIDKHISEIKGD